MSLTVQSFMRVAGHEGMLVSLCRDIAESVYRSPISPILQIPLMAISLPLSERENFFIIISSSRRNFFSEGYLTRKKKYPLLPL